MKINFSAPLTIAACLVIAIVATLDEPHQELSSPLQGLFHRGIEDFFDLL